MIFCFLRRHLKTKHPDNYKQYLTCKSTALLSLEFRVFCASASSDFMALFTWLHLLTHLLMSWFVGSLSWSWSWFCFEPQCLGLGLGTYCLTPITANQKGIRKRLDDCDNKGQPLLKNKKPWTVEFYHIIAKT